MVGTASSGPLNVPTLITSTDQFISTFGTPTLNQYGPYAALNYLRQGNQLWYQRVAKQYTTGVAFLASPITAGTNTFTVTGTSPYVTGDYVRISENGKRTTQNIAVLSVAGSVITLVAPIIDSYSVNASLDQCSLTNYPQGGANAAAYAEVFAYGRTGTTIVPMVKFTAKNPGQFANFGSANGIEIVIEDGGQYSNINPSTGLPYTSASGLALQGVMPSAPSVDTKAALLALTGMALGQIRGVNYDPSQGGSGVVYQYMMVTGTPTWVAVGVLTKRVRVLYRGQQVEIFDNLIGYDPTSANYWDTVISKSAYITADYVGTNGEQPISTYNAVNFPYNPRLLMGSTVAVGMTNTSGAAVTSFAMAAGADGSDPNQYDYIGQQLSTGWTGLQAFLRTGLYDINILCAPAVTTASVVQAILSICETRHDCFGVIDTPFGLTPQTVIDWHNGTGSYSGDHAAFVSNCSGMYWPWLQMADPYNNVNVWVPPSAVIPGVFAYNDEVGESWFAPAGITRATLNNVIKTEYHIEVGDVEQFYGPGNGNAINPIMTFNTDGVVVYGQRTLQRTPSALDRINVRRLMFYIEKAVATSARRLVFEQNDSVLWARLKGMIDPFLQSLMGLQALDWYKVVCDSTTTTPQMMNNSEVGCRIYLIPTKTAERIQLNFALLASGTNVTEFIANDTSTTINGQ